MGKRWKAGRTTVRIGRRTENRGNGSTIREGRGHGKREGQ